MKTESMMEQLDAFRKELERVYGLYTSVEECKGNKYLVFLVTPTLEKVASLSVYWLPKEGRFYMQDKKHSTYAPLRRWAVATLRDI